MKIRITFLSLLAVSAAMVASAQVVEYDDMYFTSKDRVRALASKPLTLKNISTEHEVATAINPTDSYSARNVNPEYISQKTVNPSGSSEPAPYFIPDYTPTAINQNLNTNSSSSWNNCNCASSFNNPYYGSPYGSYYPSMSSMYGYNPYGYGYNGFNSMYNSGWSSMISIGFGMGSYYPYGGSSWGMGYGMGMGGSQLWNYGFNYYGGSYGYNSYYPNNVVIINNDYNNRNVAYGKRPSRSSDLNNTVNSSNRNATMVTTDSQGRVRGSNGRIASEGTTSADSYYQRGWRTNPETNSAVRSTWSNTTRSGVEDSGRSNYGSSNSRSNSSSFFDNSSRSSSNMGGGSNFSSGGGSRSGGSSVSGSGSSSGARRGRD
jgi:hypothetical protein